MSLAPQVQSPLLLVYLHLYTTAFRYTFLPCLGVPRKPEQQLRGSRMQYDGSPSEKQWSLGRSLCILVFCVRSHSWHTVGNLERGPWSTPQGVYMPGRKGNSELSMKAELGLILSECWQYCGSRREKAFSRRCRLVSLLQWPPQWCLMKRRPLLI